MHDSNDAKGLMSENECSVMGMQKKREKKIMTLERKKSLTKFAFSLQDMIEENVEPEESSYFRDLFRTLGRSVRIDPGFDEDCD